MSKTFLCKVKNNLSIFTKDKLNIFSVIIFAFVFCILVYFNFKYLYLTIDSDFGGEMGLWNQLAQNGSILSTEWFYSTEIRLLNVQLIMPLMFSIFDNWIFAVGVGNIILYIIYSILRFFNESPKNPSKMDIAYRTHIARRLFLPLFCKRIATNLLPTPYFFIICDYGRVYPLKQTKRV